MKIRKGFVSNSSSSSFVCEVCGDVESGYDASARDVGFYVCVNDHNFCASHILPAPDQTEPVADDEEHVEGDDYDEDDEDFDDEGGYNVPAHRCPICTLTAVGDGDLARFLLKSAGKTEAEVVTSIRKTFGNYDAFAAFIRGK